MAQYLLAALVDLFIGVFAVRTRPNSATAALLFVTICSASWSFELFLLTVMEDMSVLNAWFHVFRVGMFFIPGSLALLAWCTVGGASRGFLRWVIVPSLGASASLSIANLFFIPSILRPAIHGYLPEPDAVYYAFSLLFVSTMVASIVFGVMRFRLSTTREKRRIKWFLITLGVALLSGCVSLVLMNYDFYLSKLIGVAGKVFFVGMLFYTTVQYHLMDIKLALSVGASRLLLLAFFCWAYFSVISSIATSFDSIGSTLTLMAFFVAVLESYPRILKWIEGSANRVFSISNFNFEEVVKLSRKSLNRCANSADLRRVLDYVFYDVAQVESYEIYIARESNGVDAKDFVEMSSEVRLGKINLEIVSKDSPGLPSLAFADELLGPAKAALQSTGGLSFLRIACSERLEALVVIGRPLRSTHYGYDDIRLFEWLGSELSGVLGHIRELDAYEQDLSEAKKRLSLLSMMSHYHHDIKAPLSVIDGVVSHQLYDSEKQRQVILEQVALGSKLIATMASLLNGKRRRRIAPVDLQQVLNECLVLFRQKLAKVDVKLCDGAVVQGDADDLKIMFINLIKNAAEAAQPGGKVSLAVKARLQDDCVSVSIRDNGVGMEAEKLGRIWESPASSKPGGHGIGLQAIKRIADEHHTLIDVISRPGEGSEFILSFPLVVPALRFADTA